MNGVNKVLYGSVMFGLGTVAGYFVSKKRLEESY